MNNLDLAKTTLLENKCSIVVVKYDEVVFTSYDKGLKPLIYLFENENKLLKDAYIADKVIGKAAAFILIDAGIKELYADLISDKAIEILAKENISYEYGRRTEEIRNRDNTGMCPMEEIALESQNADELISNIKERFNK